MGSDNDVVYVMEAIRYVRHGRQPVARIKGKPMRDAPVAWHTTGGTGAASMTNDNRRGLQEVAPRYAPDACDVPDGGFNFEGRHPIMEERLAAKKLRVAGRFVGLVRRIQRLSPTQARWSKVDDDLLSATRVGCMTCGLPRRSSIFPRCFAPARLRAGRSAPTSTCSGT